jgi:mRNA-degrading endonuclease RelE of RelBE toxin-antitoxin system
MNAPGPVLFFPKALRDLERLDRKQQGRIFSDIELLRTPPWPVGKVKRLQGVDLWEVKSGDFRVLFLPHQGGAVIVRIVNRRDLERAVGKVDPAYVFRWLANLKGR